MNSKLKQGNLQYEKVEGYSRTKTTRSKVLCLNNFSNISQNLKDLDNLEHNICLRGSGITYADMILNNDNAILDFKECNKIIKWSSELGQITVQSGVTLGSILQICHMSGWHLNACPGSPKITVGGAVSNNVHGKESHTFGNFGSQVKSMKILTADGEEQIISPLDGAEIFNGIVGGIGLVAIILEVTLQLTKISSPFVEVKTEICENIFDICSKLDEDDGYSFKVAWCDAFAEGTSLGRGYISKAAWLRNDNSVDADRLKESLTPSSKVLNIFPTKAFWKCGRPFFKPFTIRQINRFIYHKTQKDLRLKGVNVSEMLFSSFNFVHNRLPNMNDVYRPYGFVEIQPIIPRSAGHHAVKELIMLCQKEGWQSLLCGIKRHSKDPFLLSFEGDGYSIGIDISLRGRDRSEVIKTANKIYDFIIECGGKVYLAKDELLTRRHFEMMYPRADKFWTLKNKMDPKRLLMSDMARRLFL